MLNPREVWVVHGRNTAARDAMFEFLHAIGLKPIEWSEAVASLGDGAASIEKVLERGFSVTHAVLVLLTGDDMAYLRWQLAGADESTAETTPTPQARPNVLFETGMALGRNPTRTVLVALGHLRPFSDVAGKLQKANQCGGRSPEFGRQVKVNRLPGRNRESHRMAPRGKFRCCGCWF